MTENLIFFNKEGHQLNTDFNAETLVHSSSIFFDKNSVDTYKTQGIYAFEKLDGSNNTFSATLERFQAFNTNGMTTIPGALNAYTITDIQVVNNDANYNTKWIYAAGIEKDFYKGMWCNFTDLNGFHNNDFDTNIINTQVFKILAVETGRVLVYTTTTNDNALPTFNILNAQIVPLDVIELVQKTVGEPAYNETSITAKLYPNKKLSLVGNTDADGLYTVDTVCNVRQKDAFFLAPGAFTPIAGDRVLLNIQIRTSNIMVSNGSTDFNGQTIYMPYIPSFLKVNDQIQVLDNGVVSLTNLATHIVESIDRTTSTITVNTSLVTETVTCQIFLAGNNILIDQEVVLDNNNVYSLPLTYDTIVAQYSNALAEMAGGVDLTYNVDTDTLEITTEFTDSYIVVNFSSISNTEVVTPLIVTTQTYDVYPISVKESLDIYHEYTEHSSVYQRSIVFSVIDPSGLAIIINGRNYYTPFTTDVATTLAAFVAGYTVELSKIGIDILNTTTNIVNDTIRITAAYPNVPIIITLVNTDATNCVTRYMDTNINNIKSQLIITIDGIQYATPFNTDDDQTVADWVTTHGPILDSLNIIVVNVPATSIIQIDVRDPEKRLDISYNLGYLPKMGDVAVYETLYSTVNNGGVVAGNEIICAPGLYDFSSYYSVGQKLSINGAFMNIQNRSYNVVAITDQRISLSYQGSFWNQALAFAINIVSDYFIRYPRMGTTDLAERAKFRWTWYNTQINDFFLYDFSGSQLVPAFPYFPAYNGPIPLCGLDGEIQLQLNFTPNTDITQISNPLVQQTIFDTLSYTIPFTDEAFDGDIEPDPMQVFIGYRAGFEGWNKARLHLELVEDIKFTLLTDVNLIDDLWVFNENYVELQSLSIPIDLRLLGFRTGQDVVFTAKDMDADGQQLGILKNAGLKFTISDVQTNRLYFTVNVTNETSVCVVPKNTMPFVDINGDPIMLNRRLEVSVSVLPKVVSYFDVYGESEDEDERHRINLDNRNLNILKMQDFFIFREADIKEEGVDWILLNRKRKELIEIYGELFNSLSSYKSVIQAINFFGYNDLTFTEYFQNIDPENKKFGQLFNLELLNLLNKDVAGYTYSNVGYETLRNAGYRKTNLFSLNYRITDEDGNFVDAYSLDEVKVKLLGLKRWLTENIIPIGTKITDINGKYQMRNDFIIQHDTYMTKNYRVEEYADSIDFDVSGYLQPVTEGSNNYDIRVEFTSAAPQNWYEYKIRTFQLEQWTNISYLVDSYVFYNNAIWVSNLITQHTQVPGLSSVWEKTSIDRLPNVQIIRDYKTVLDQVGFTVNELVDPYFVVEVYWHSGYGCTRKAIKSYSLPITIQPQLNIYPVNLSVFDYNFNFDYNQL